MDDFPLMPFRSAYTFEGVPRLSYGWENPNHAAAVLVCVVPLFWAAQRMARQRRIALRWILLGGEALCSLMLTLTYSRGGVLGWLLSVLFFGWFSVDNNRDADRSRGHRWLFWLPRFTLMGVILLSIGLDRRFSAVSAGDASAVNRLELWNGGLQLIAGSPLAGWGKGNSGLAYMQWVQEPTASTSYNGMVNSYLHLAVEFGLPAFSILCFLLIFSVVAAQAGITSFREERGLLLAGCAASLVGFAGASVFSTLWVVRSVIWMPALVLFFIIYNLEGAIAMRALARQAILSFCAAVALGLLLYSASLIAAGQATWRLRRAPDGGVLFVANPSHPDTREVTFLADGRTLGPYYGREIRRAILAFGDVRRFMIYPVGAVPRGKLADCAVLLGPRIDELGAIYGPVSVCAVFPVGHPAGTDSLQNLRLLALPQYDQMGYAGMWQALSEVQRYSVRIIPGAGQDARAAWVDIFKYCLIATRR